MAEVTREDTSKQPAAVTSKGQLPQPAQQNVTTPKDKRSWDYIWRSGVAGGLAGCAVGFPLPFST